MKVIRPGDPVKAKLVNEMVEDFQRRRPKYERLTEELSALLRKILAEEKIKGTIESRTKDLESFREKLWRKNYKDPFSEMTDFSGIRIIVNSLEDQTRVALLIQREFEIDKERSINKRKELSLNQFGYLSRHFIVKVSTARQNLSEWRGSKGLWAEIQLRTALQHAWSTIEHGLNYKPDATMTTDMKRDLFRLSALFELADKELNSIVASANEIERWGGVTEFDDDMLLDETNLKSYVDVASQINMLASRLEANGWDTPYDDSPENFGHCIIAAHKMGVFTLSEFEWVLKQLDSQAYDILNHVSNENGGNGIERVEMQRTLIIAFRPELFPDEKELIDMIDSRHS